MQIRGIKITAWRIFWVLLTLFAVWNIIRFYQNKEVLFKVYNVPAQYTISSGQGDLDIVAFIDFSCIHCRDLHTNLDEAMQRDGNIRFIPRPITFDEKSYNIKLIAAIYAAANQDKFAEMYNKIYDSWPIEDDEHLFAVAGELGLDVRTLSRDMNSAQVQAMIKQNQFFFKEWGFWRVPALIVGKQGVYFPGPKSEKDGPVTPQEIYDRLQLARKSQIPEAQE